MKDNLKHYITVSTKPKRAQGQNTCSVSFFSWLLSSGPVVLAKNNLKSRLHFKIFRKKSVTSFHVNLFKCLSLFVGKKFFPVSTLKLFHP